MAEGRFVCLLLLTLQLCSGQDEHHTSNCYDASNRPQRCIPEFVNAAFNVLVEATSTCGLHEPSEYCRQTAVDGAERSCELCDNAVPPLRHPPEYLTDFNNNDNQTYWQSETMYDGIEYPREVNLTLHLRRPFDITYIRLKFQSMRPESFAIYKKAREGEPWVPYQFYSLSCKDTYGITPGQYITYVNETVALCTSDYSHLVPITGGNVAFSTLEGRPSAYNFQNSPAMQEWVTAIGIRIVLTRMNTYGDEVFREPIVLKSYYYAISDFAVGGRCKCNGHAQACDPSPNDYRLLLCRCEHNTAGISCEQCLPFYQDQPWGRATSTDAHECKPCNCNGRSNKCYFDKELFDRTGHGGHCIDCIDNTDGPNCERCKQNYFQRSDGRCIACDCDPTGSRSLQCNSQGQCPCKPGVEGQRCDRCDANFYEFSAQGCRPCGCVVSGSVDNNPSCDEVTGDCRCKENVEGQKCDRCKPGFFNLQTSNEFGCTPCFCFGHSAVCSSAPGYSKFSIQSTFSRDRERWKAADQAGRDVPTRYESVGQNLAVAAPERESVYFLAPDRYLGDQRTSYNQDFKFQFRIGEDGPRATVEDLIFEGSHISISQPIFGQGNHLPSIRNQDYVFRLHEDPNFGWTPRLSSHDFISVLSNLTAIKIKATYTARGTGFLDNVNLNSAQQSPHGSEATWIEMCTCSEGYVGQFCESCAPGYRHDPPEGGSFSRCVPCNCHGHADICEPDTGRCICQHNTAGDNCDRCAEGYYGTAVRGTPDDCQPCPCPDQGACTTLPDGKVVCLKCPTGYTGHRCDLCFDGYFGDPQGRLGPRRDCQRCNCNDNIDQNAVANCNTTTGECLKCIYNTAGPHCEQCLPGHYGNPLALPKGDCKACDCYDVGTVSDHIHSTTLCDPHSGQCRCKQNVQGRQCDQCREGFWNLYSGSGCEPCNCDLIGSLNRTCNVHTGQCYCRPGVMGKNCDQCQAYHFGFSPDGCQACDCDPVGSVSLQCAPNGQCECRQNVEGRQCERCKENKYDKEAGCVDCPPCYNLVQDAVIDHREKLSELADLLEDIQRNPQVVDDLDFREKLNEVMTVVEVLLNDARIAAGSDRSLMDQLNALRRRIEEVRVIAGKVSEEIAKADAISESGQRNITLTEGVIKQAEEDFLRAKRYLETEGQEALRRALERSNRFGQQSERLSEISKMARQLAETHENEADEVAHQSDDALKTSNESYRIIEEALHTQDRTKEEISRLSQRMQDMKSSLENTKKMAEAGKDQASDAYNDALKVFTESNSTQIPLIDAERMKQQAQDIIEEAQRIQADAAKLLKDHEELIRDVIQQQRDAEKLLNETQHQQQITDGLLADTDAALDKAKKATERADAILADAQRTLETLQDFQNDVARNRENSRRALDRVPEIEALIREAEEKTRQANDALAGANQDADQAKDYALQAQRIAEQASNDANEIREEAKAKKETAENLKGQAEDLNDDVLTTDDRMKEYEKQADDDEKLALDGLQKANEASTSARDASKKVRDAQELLNRINELLARPGGDIDTRLLEELERKLNETERELADANLDARTAELVKARELQNQWMRDYEKEIEQLKKDVANVKDIRDSLPDTCYRRIKLEP